MPHVIGAEGNIAAILWATPDALHVPALPRQARIQEVERVQATGAAQRYGKASSAHEGFDARQLKE
jgi:hypothetical protein